MHKCFIKHKKYKAQLFCPKSYPQTKRLCTNAQTGAPH